jgi:hypothetical protein
LIFFLCIFRTRKWPRFYSDGDQSNGTQQGPTYLAECVRRRQFHTNYIIFRNVKIFRNYFFQFKKYCEGK